MQADRSKWRAAYKLWLVVRGSLFWIVFLPSVLICVVFLTLTMKLPVSVRVAILKVWIKTNLGWIRLTCGLDYQVEGLENIPPDGFIVMSKHSSTWETLALQLFFRPMVWVVKRELLFVPFFGWGLKAMNAIAINRGTGRKAIKQLVEEGRKHMDDGRIVMLFPEGTRVLPGQHKPYKLGGAILAQKTGYSILPVAHNAGEYWPRHSWIKWPGTIKLVIGKAIEPGDRKPGEIIDQVEQWITETGERISDREQLEKLGIEI